MGVEQNDREPTREEEIGVWRVALRASIAGLAFRGLGRDEIMVEIEDAFAHHERQAEALEALFGQEPLSPHP